MSPAALNRRQFLAVTAGGLLSTAAARAQPLPSPKVENGIAWYDVSSWGVEGKGWSDTKRYYDRLPGKAEGVVPAAVWNLSRDSAGMLTRFETDAPEIRVRYALAKANLAMPIMDAVGVSGVDLYGRDDRGRDRWLGISRPAAQKVEATLAQGIEPLEKGGARLYTLYLPLYNGVETLEIGVPATANFRPVPPRKEKPVLFYGTSIMHGASASRTGMSITALVGRRLNRPVINLGFSGNGRMDSSVGALLAELDPCAYCIDCLPNMAPEQVAERAEPLVRQLRAARPTTPILLVEDRTFTNAGFFKNVREQHAARRANLRKAYDNLRAAGVRGLAYLHGEDLLGSDGEGATDGSHPNDLGMTRYADAYVAALRPLLSG